MKLFDINGNLVVVNISGIKNPVRQVSKSSLQTLVGDYLLLKYPRYTILEDFVIPGSRMSVDFFMPNKRLVIEVQGKQHDEHVPFFHGSRQYAQHYAKQKLRDMKKVEWAEINGFKFIEIRSKDDVKDRL